MREWIDKILVVINECKDPINNFQSRTLRDDALEILSTKVNHMSRQEFESFAKNEDEEKSLHWFYTKFIHNRYTTAGAGRIVKNEN